MHGVRHSLCVSKISLSCYWYMFTGRAICPLSCLRQSISESTMYYVYPHWRQWRWWWNYRNLIYSCWWSVVYVFVGIFFLILKIFLRKEDNTGEIIKQLERSWPNVKTVFFCYFNFNILLFYGWFVQFLFFFNVHMYFVVLNFIAIPFQLC